LTDSESTNDLCFGKKFSFWKKNPICQILNISDVSKVFCVFINKEIRYLMMIFLHFLLIAQPLWKIHSRNENAITKETKISWARETNEKIG